MAVQLCRGCLGVFKIWLIISQEVRYQRKSETELQTDRKIQRRKSRGESVLPFWEPGLQTYE